MGSATRGRELHQVRSTVQHTPDVEHLPSPANRHARTAACYRGCPGVLTVHTSQPDLALADVCAPEMSDELINAQPNPDRELDLLFGLVSQRCADLEREEVPLRRYQEVTLVGRAGRRHGGPAAKELLGNE